jgi:hypothetical protein
MDMGNFNLFIKMIQDEYKLSHLQLETLTRRMLADELEFEKVWTLYKNKHRKFSGGVDAFKSVLHELLN